MSYTSILDPNDYFNRYMQIVPMSSYPQQVKDEIRLLSYSPDMQASPFGSYVFRIQKYPGDVDLHQVIHGKTEKQVVTNFVKAIKRIVRNIRSRKQHYYSEIKAGIDIRYDIILGFCENGIWKPNRNLVSTTKKMYEQGLLQDKEANLVISTVSGHTTLGQNAYDIIYFLFREHRVLRWTEKEILKGSKKLIKNKTITLAQAVDMNTLLKIDDITVIDGKFIEATNAYYLSYGPTNIEIQIPQDRYYGLLQEIEKMYYSNMWYNPFKCMKRMFSWARIDKEKNRDLLVILAKFISSNTSQVYQIKSEISTIILILNKFRNPSPKTIASQLDNMKQRLVRIVEFSPLTIQIFDAVINKFINDDLSRGQQISLLEYLEKILKRQINRSTIEYFITAGINPPSKVIPFDTRTYAEVVRQPDDEPKV